MQRSANTDQYSNMRGRHRTSLKIHSPNYPRIGFMCHLHQAVVYTCAHVSSHAHSIAKKDLKDIWVQEQSGDAPGDTGVGRRRGSGQMRVEGDLGGRGGGVRGVAEAEGGLEMQW